MKFVTTAGIKSGPDLLHAATVNYVLIGVTTRGKKTLPVHAGFGVQCCSTYQRVEVGTGYEGSAVISLSVS